MTATIPRGPTRGPEDPRLATRASSPATTTTTLPAVSERHPLNRATRVCCTSSAHRPNRSAALLDHLVSKGDHGGGHLFGLPVGLLVVSGLRTLDERADWIPEQEDPAPGWHCEPAAGSALSLPASQGRRAIARAAISRSASAELRLTVQSCAVATQTPVRRRRGGRSRYSGRDARGGRHAWSRLSGRCSRAAGG